MPDSTSTMTSRSNTCSNILQNSSIQWQCINYTSLSNWNSKHTIWLYQNISIHSKYINQLYQAKALNYATQRDWYLPFVFSSIRVVDPPRSRIYQWRTTAIAWNLWELECSAHLVHIDIHVVCSDWPSDENSLLQGTKLKLYSQTHHVSNWLICIMIRNILSLLLLPVLALSVFTTTTNNLEKESVRKDIHCMIQRSSRASGFLENQKGDKLCICRNISGKLALSILNTK